MFLETLVARFAHLPKTRWAWGAARRGPGPHPRHAAAAGGENGCWSQAGHSVHIISLNPHKALARGLW